MFQNPSDDEIRALLKRVKRIAVVGLSPNPERPSYGVSAFLQRVGYRIVPVRPKVTEVLGEPAFATLDDVPGQIDLVDVFRRAEEIDAVVDDAIRLKLPAIWIQLGIVNEPAAERARAAGLTVVMDRCIKIEYARLCV
ncbi:CoA-binding protein [Chitiniphilus shinanonensis]|uniref:CoA-binding protein n=1 Tax=Chitiniphilus shinanonensis TaxID=553088 RepID=A0ABQ6BRA8_9NEIS|nr:CoA-binding protein [Chitiniphilus shinanonensis]GLS04540.1 CoA-binding protein [Chitiniphilus shinanonensis]